MFYEWFNLRRAIKQEQQSRHVHTEIEAQLLNKRRKYDASFRDWEKM